MQQIGSLQEKSPPDARIYGLKFQCVREKRLCSSPGDLHGQCAVGVKIKNDKLHSFVVNTYEWPYPALGREKLSHWSPVRADVVE